MGNPPGCKLPHNMLPIVRAKSKIDTCQGKEDHWKCRLSSLKSADLASVRSLSFSFFCSARRGERACGKAIRSRNEEESGVVRPLRPHERNSSWLSTPPPPPPSWSPTLSNSRVTLLPALITSLRNDLLIYRLISRRWLPDVSLPDRGRRAAHICKILEHGWTRDPDRTAITKILYRSDDRQQWNSMNLLADEKQNFIRVRRNINAYSGGSSLESAREECFQKVLHIYTQESRYEHNRKFRVFLIRSHTSYEFFYNISAPSFKCIANRRVVDSLCLYIHWNKLSSSRTTLTNSWESKPIALANNY